MSAPKFAEDENCNFKFCHKFELDIDDEKCPFGPLKRNTIYTFSGSTCLCMSQLEKRHA